jgi:hypothetical protein
MVVEAAGGLSADIIALVGAPFLFGLRYEQPSAFFANKKPDRGHELIRRHYAALAMPPACIKPAIELGVPGTMNPSR